MGGFPEGDGADGPLSQARNSATVSETRPGGGDVTSCGCAYGLCTSTVESTAAVPKASLVGIDVT